jgi:hypothetical protein
LCGVEGWKPLLILERKIAPLFFGGKQFKGSVFAALISKQPPKGTRRLFKTLIATRRFDPEAARQSPDQLGALQGGPSRTGGKTPGDLPTRSRRLGVQQIKPFDSAQVKQ